jgi:hypothetical protein
MRVARLSVVLVTAMLFTTAPRSSAQQTSSVLTLPDGRVIEVLGLRRWTIGMLQDSLAKYAPADSLQSHACAVTLRYKLHFADAASTSFDFGPGTPERVVVAVREPQDSARVHYRLMPLDTLSARIQWPAITTVYSRHPNVFWPEVQRRLRPSKGRAPTYRTREDSALATRFVATLDSLTRERDRLEAKRVLSNDPNMYHRVAAAVILANFAGRDETWWSLVEALRESDGQVKGVAATVLVGLSRRRPRAVRWAPRATTVHALLDGTSLFVLDAFIQVLTATGVGPKDARTMIGNGGGEMLLAYLGSGTGNLASHSRALLTALRGADLGPEAEPWRAWMATL